MDYYRFEAKAGQEVGVRIQPVAKAKLDVVLQLIDADGRLLTESKNGLLGFTSHEDWILRSRRPRS